MTQGYDFSDPANPVQRTIAYNADNMPLSVTMGLATTQFRYDGNGARAVKETGGSATHYVSGGYEVTNGVVTKYIAGIAKIENGVITYQHSDHLGSSTTWTDSSGQCLEQTDYRPFGEERNHWGVTADKHRYTNQEKDFSTNLYNYNARLYDPILGRFISADTLVPEPLNPQCLNRYAYCLNNPLAYTDPSGHFVEEAIWFAINVIIAGAHSDWNPEAMIQAAAYNALSAGFAYGAGELRVALDVEKNILASSAASGSRWYTYGIYRRGLWTSHAVCGGGSRFGAIWRYEIGLDAN